MYLPITGIKKACRLFSTPFFLYSEKKIRENCRFFFNSFKQYFPDFRPLFAVKANPNPAILRIIQQEGFGFDCSSESELWIVKKIKGHGMHTGNYIVESELRRALTTPNVVLNLDDESMLTKVGQLGMPKTLSFRINPGIVAVTMKSLQTAGPNAKFGVPIERVVASYQKAKQMGVETFGIHMMAGSNILDEKHFYGITSKLLEIVGILKKRTGIQIDFLNIGGGFGVPYQPSERSLDLNLVAKSVRKAFDEQCHRFSLKEPQLFAEPGRYITANAGWLVSQAVVIKNSHKKFIGIDASSNDLPRPSIYGAYHHATVLNKTSKRENVTIVGSICENNDQLATDRLLPKCEIGDIIVLHNAGGHAYAMGHNYNGKTRHAEYLLMNKSNLKCIRRAETIADLFKRCNE
ncbi:MAG: diaminopimelate decarboxylase [Candidatus Magasanikbacteria bacterium RIFOXYD2_FULL_41_14]|uniref:Diaminopimelate decarboxylase n=1 Tax=Candidatus Magasanikbacteria bacterium RIFOXYD2_FULL_41_14 TaxID=1798709 RepID=A0A1F6PES3_9BACT|nr:MAG: diaminopimelate decarboxylase [Candidatus Magasanikbacteria bacterium RIFOXYD2_FULL_41_14]